MEFADDGDLFQRMTAHRKRGTSFSVEQVWSVFVQVLAGLKVLHSLHILHRDLKSANVFLFKNSVAKLGDLNVSKVARKGLGHTQTGTPYYASPEVWRDKPYDKKSDMWSLGCVLYEMIALRPPFAAEDMDALYKKVQKGIYPKISSPPFQELGQVVNSLLQVSPHIRPSCGKRLRRVEEVLSMSAVEMWSGKLLPRGEQVWDEDSVLLRTIRVPKNLMHLSDQLPKPRYTLMDKGRTVNKREERYRSSKRNVSNDVSLLPIISAHKATRNTRANKSEMSIAPYSCKNAKSPEASSAEITGRQNSKIFVVIKDKSKSILGSNIRLRQQLVLPRNYISNEQSRNSSVAKSVDFTSRKLQELPSERNSMIKKRTRQRIGQLLRISRTKIGSSLKLPSQLRIQQLISKNQISPVQKVTERHNRFVNMLRSPVGIKERLKK